MMQCRLALEAAGGDVGRAVELLRQKGIEVAEKKSSRALSAGVVSSYVHNDGKIGAIIALVCETDFVAANGEFKILAHELAMQVAATGPADLDELLQQSFIKDQSKTVKDVLVAAVQKFGERTQIKQFARFSL